MLNRVLSLVAALCVLAIASAAEAPGARDPSALLDRLKGKWDMAGILMKRPVRYEAEGRRVLQGGFLELHMIDVQSPPQYEASVFIGYDTTVKDYIAHWLDQFGAAGARVVGEGWADGNQIVIAYPYAEGAFRNTFTWNDATHGWHLVIESQSKDGKWSTFADYMLTRPESPGAPGR